MKKVLFLRPYYGVNIHSDAHGELGEQLNTRDVFPDLTLLTAATIFKETNKYEVKVIDAVLEDEMLPDVLLEKIDDDYYDIVIMRVSAPTIRSDIQMAKMLKARLPESEIMVGGQTAKVLHRWINEHVKEIDYVIDEPMDEFAMHYNNAKVNGSFLNSFPTPDYSLVNYHGYLDDNKRIRLTLMASRGCPMECSYCPYKSYYRNCEYRDIELVIEDMKKLIRLGAEVIQFRDQFFTSDKKRIKNLCERIIEEGINVEWICETRLTSLDKELLDLLKKAGVILICFGVESGDFELLEKYNSIKGQPNSMKEIISYANELGIITMAFYIIGFPEEDWTMVEKTYHYADQLDSTYAIFNEYEDCDFGNIKENLSPEIFVPFGNTTTIETTRKLNKDERRYIVSLYSIMYTMRISFEGGYSYNYKLITKNKRIIRKIQPFAEDLFGLSNCIRGLKNECNGL